MSICYRKPKQFFYFIFQDPHLFINSISVCAGSFFVVTVHFVIQASVVCFGGSGYCAWYWNSHCSMNSLKAFKVACRLVQYCIPFYILVAICWYEVIMKEYNNKESKSQAFIFFSYFSLPTQTKAIIACFPPSFFLFIFSWLLHPIILRCKRMS